MLLSLACLPMIANQHQADLIGSIGEFLPGVFELGTAPAVARVIGNMRSSVLRLVCDRSQCPDVHVFLLLVAAAPINDKNILRR
jgi:hypothetical protein